MMSPDRWEQVKSLLDQVLDRPPAERPTFLSRACGGDADLLAELASLAAAHERDPAFIETPAVVRGNGATATATGQDDAGRRIGPYELIRSIGAGGMGSVYLAVRADDEYRKLVAIKLIATDGGNSARRTELLRRLRFERQTLANLDHPNIARLLDGGTTPAGEPYLVMEYVDGLAIDAYCEERGLNTLERLRLFRSVCAAVQFAHQNLVVHRDLKPGNILVTRDGTPKLLDFGIAKLLDADDSRLAGGELTTSMPMTPAYASPEQVRGQAITTASDVYSLGVVLYELLTDCRPYPVADQPPHQLARLICEYEPLPPSTRVTAGRGPRSGDASGSATTIVGAVALTELPAQRRRRLVGEIDAIVLTALRKEPARRYPSVEQLSEDIRRHLDGLPVAACRDTFAYRVRKFIGRHRVGMASAALVLLALCGGLAGTLWQARVAATERDAAQEARRRADKQRAAAEQHLARALSAEGASRRDAQTSRRVLEFMQTVLAGANPYEAPRTTAEDVAAARTILDRAAQRLGSQLGEEPAARASAQHMIGMAYRTLGEFDGALALQQAALDTLRAATPRDERAIADCLTELGNLQLGQKRFAAAEPCFREALELYAACGADATIESARCMVNLGSALRQRRDLAGADEVLAGGLARYRERYGPDHPDVLSTLENIALLRKDQRDYAAAVELLTETLDQRLRIFGEEHPAVAATHNDLGLVLYHSGRLQAAEEHLRAAIGISRRLFGAASPGLATQLNNLGLVLAAAKRNAEAEAAYAEALEMRRDLLGPDHSDVGETLNNLGGLRFNESQWDAAERLLREAVEIRRRTLGPTHPATLLNLNNLGVALFQGGRLEESEATLREALDAARQTLAASDPFTSDVSYALAECLIARQSYAEAEPLLLARIEHVRGRHGAEDDRTRKLLRRAMRLYEAWGRPEQAAEYRALVAGPSGRSE